jgi:hypothetical protein
VLAWQNDSRAGSSEVSTSCYDPARDLGLRFFVWLTGWGKVAFPGAHGYFWSRSSAPDVEGLGETVEERPTAAGEQVDARGGTVRER